MVPAEVEASTKARLLEKVGAPPLLLISEHAPLVLTSPKIRINSALNFQPLIRKCVERILQR